MTRYYFLVVKPLVHYFTDLFLDNLVTQLEEGKSSSTSDDAVSVTDSVSSSDVSSNSSGGSWRQPFQCGEEVDGLSPEDGMILAQARTAYLEHNTSQSEATRLIRGIYRVQIWCNLFGFGPGPSLRGLDKTERADADRHEVACIFFETFEPWEVEEILCIYEPIRSAFVHLFEDMRTELLEYNKKRIGEIGLFGRRYDERDYDRGELDYDREYTFEPPPAPCHHLACDCKAYLSPPLSLSQSDGTKCCFSRPETLPQSPENAKRGSGRPPEDCYGEHEASYK